MAIEVVLPALGITVEKGKILQWYKKEGDPVQKGEPLFLVEADKVTTDVESPATGVLGKISIPLDVEVPILTVVAVIKESKEELSIVGEPQIVVSAHESRGQWIAPERPRGVPAGFPGLTEKLGVMPAARVLAKNHGLNLKEMVGTGPDGAILVRDVKAALLKKPKTPGIKVSTLARKLAEKEGIPLAEVQGTGVRGRIMCEDVKAYAESETGTTPGFGVTHPMSSIRRVVARKMAESALAAPHIHFFTEVWFDPLLEFRQKVLPDFERQFNLRPSINDFLVKAAALTILDFPLLNARLKGEEIHIVAEIHIGLAVAMPEGLIVPAIAHADRAGLVEIVRQREDLVARAREGKLTLSEMERGTFTISSLAHYDITHFTAILNPPQSGILSVGKTDEKLTMVDGRIEVRHVMRLGLSVDHRVIDGAVAADFLQNLKWKIERPSFTFLKL
jgi:pyruvate dehydrogenase E2 component (dihydrolipoamide acetyltransferase)